MSRWHALLVLAAGTTGCFEVTYTEGYRITYGEGQWARTGGVGDTPLRGSREALQGQGIFAIAERLYLPLPTDGRVVTPAERRGKRKRRLEVCLKLTEEGRKKLSEWRDNGRRRGLLLSTKGGDFRTGSFETVNLPDFRATSVPYSSDDIRALFAENGGKVLPEHATALCIDAEAVLRLHKAPKLGSTYARLPYPYYDVLGSFPDVPEGYSPNYFKQLPIDLRLIGDFRTRSGEAERREFRLQYDRWDRRLHSIIGEPYDPRGFDF